MAAQALFAPKPQAEWLTLVTGDFLITVIVTWAIAVFGICMLLFMLLTPNEMFFVLGVRQIPTLSLSGAYQPMEAIFTLGLHWLSAGTALFFSVVFNSYRIHLDAMAHASLSHEALSCCCCCCKISLPMLKRCNQLLLAIGLGFSVFMSLVGAIPLSLNDTGHGTVAIIMFVLGVVHVLVHQSTLAQIAPRRSPRQRILGKVAFIFVAPLPFVSMLTILFVFVGCHTRDCLDYVVQMLVVVEFQVAIGLLVYVESFRGAELARSFVRVHQEAASLPSSTSMSTSPQPPSDVIPPSFSSPRVAESKESGSSSPSLELAPV